LVPGVFDRAGKQCAPELGSFVIDALTVMLSMPFPAGLHGKRA
jgi:hypothetical protein